MRSTQREQTIVYSLGRVSSIECLVSAVVFAASKEGVIIAWIVTNEI